MQSVEQNVREAVVKGAVEAAASPLTAMQGSDVNIVTAKVTQAVAPLVAHATNSEPWYQSRVTVGNYVAMAAVIIGPLLGRTFDAEDQALVTSIITGAGVLIGAAVSLYGRWFAKKPIGG